MQAFTQIAENYSEDAENWTVLTPEARGDNITSGSGYDIETNGKEYVAILDYVSSGVVYSPDGSLGSWVKQKIETSNNSTSSIYGIGYGDGRFLIGQYQHPSY